MARRQRVGSVVWFMRISAASRSGLSAAAYCRAQGWSYADILPYFKRMEHWHGGDNASGWRGGNGPLHISRGPRDNPLTRAFVEAGGQAGYALTDEGALLNAMARLREAYPNVLHLERTFLGGAAADGTAGGASARRAGQAQAQVRSAP